MKVEQQTVNVGGDFISPVIVGDNANVVIKSQQIVDAFKNIRSAVDEDEAIKNKDEAHKLIEELQNEIVQLTPEPSKVKSVLTRIKGLGGKLNDQILSQPIIAQLIAQMLLKTME